MYVCPGPKFSSSCPSDSQRFRNFGWNNIMKVFRNCRLIEQYKMKLMPEFINARMSIKSPLILCTCVEICAQQPQQQHQYRPSSKSRKPWREREKKKRTKQISLAFHTNDFTSNLFYGRNESFYNKYTRTITKSVEFPNNSWIPFTCMFIFKKIQIDERYFVYRWIQ